MFRYNTEVSSQNSFSQRNPPPEAQQDPDRKGWQLTSGGCVYFPGESAVAHVVGRHIEMTDWKHKARKWVR
jgi:hypothetical protein